MKRTLIGTRFTTGCGHSWKRRHPQWTRRDLGGATTDCLVCDELLLIPREQFEGKDPGGFPPEVHMPLFHKEMAKQDPGWPSDGAGTGYAEFPIS
jgi:hypothetical protein